MPPSRPRNHEVETESERVFAYWLPSSWVYRPQAPDYGIDGEVEIFEDQHATGMTFKVQLKGTDTDRRSRSIEIDTLGYWRSLDVPVLVVFYESSTEVLYGRWAHAHDPHIRHHPTQKTTTFRFTDDERLPQDRTVLRQRLRGDVARYRDARNGSLVEPLTYAVEFTHVPDSPQRRLALRRLLDSSPLHTSPAPAEVATLRIECGPDQFWISGPVGMATVTVHDPPDPHPEDHAANIVAAMGLVLAGLGAGVLAVNLFVAAAGARLFRTFEVASAAGTCLGATGRYADAIATSGPLVRDADPRVRDAGNLVLSLAVLGKPLPLPVSEDLLSLMHDLIEIEIVQDRHVRAATAYYNFGQHLGALGRHELALAAYRAAAEYNAGYLEQGYYNRELGGLHHLLRDHAAAASAYRRALQHRGDPAQLAPLLADSLLLSGRYRESIKALEGWDATESPSAALAAIVGVVADLVIRTTGLTEQTRHDPLPDEDVLRAVPSACRDFLTDLDALDHRYWLAAAEVLPDEDALPWGTLLAHLTNDPRFWAMATVTAHRLDSPLVYDLAEQAYRCCADEYLNTLDFLCDPGEEGESWFDLSREETAKLVDEMYERLASRPDHRPSPTMRLVPPTARGC